MSNNPEGPGELDAEDVLIDEPEAVQGQVLSAEASLTPDEQAPAAPETASGLSVANRNAVPEEESETSEGLAMELWEFLSDILDSLLGRDGDSSDANAVETAQAAQPSTAQISAQVASGTLSARALTGSEWADEICAEMEAYQAGGETVGLPDATTDQAAEEPDLLVALHTENGTDDIAGDEDEPHWSESAIAS